MPPARRRRQTLHVDSGVLLSLLHHAVWNTLSPALRPSINTFKQKLKTRLSRQQRTSSGDAVTVICASAAAKCQQTCLTTAAYTSPVALLVCPRRVLALQNFSYTADSYIFGRPLVRRFALCYQSVVCPVLSVTLVYCVAKQLDGSRCYLA